MILQNNLLSLHANRQVWLNIGNLSKSTNKLSSGSRINCAADDAAGLSISEKMRGQIRGLRQACRNIQDGISLVQTAEGALGEIQSIVHRIRELSLYASNGINEIADRLNIQEEIDELVQEVSSISENTNFNNIKLLNGNLKAVSSPSSIVVLNNNDKQQVLALTQAVDSVGSNEIGLIFTDGSEYETAQSTLGNSTSIVYGTAILDELKTMIVPQAVQSILNTYSGALSYLSGSSIGIGLRLSSQSSSYLAAINLSTSTNSTPKYKIFNLDVNVYSLSFSNGMLTESSRKELESTISHEMIHALMDESVAAGMIGYNGIQSVTAYPRWFTEGFAQTAGGGGLWVKAGLGLSPFSDNSTISSALATLSNGTNAANYGVGYLACMYLGYMAGGGTGAVNAITIGDGLDIILQSLTSGKSLDQTIKDYTKYSGFSDFTSNLQNDTDAFTFVRDLISKTGSGFGSVISGDLADTDLLADTAITNLSLFQLNTAYEYVKNIYPSNVNVFSGGATTESGTKAVPEGPDAPAVDGGGGAISTVIDLSDLANVNFSAINGVEYDQTTNSIIIKANGSYTFSGSDNGANIIINAGVVANVYADNITCKNIYGNYTSTLNTYGEITSVDGINGPVTLVNYGVLNCNINQAGVTNFNTINGNIDAAAISNFGGGVINGNAAVSDMILNRGRITGTCTGNVKHFVSSYIKNIQPPPTINVGESLPGSSSLISTINAHYNGTSESLNGIWVVSDKSGNIISDPSNIIMNEGDYYTYTLTFDGTAYNMYFNSETVSALISSSSFALTPDGGIISASGRTLQYTYTVAAGAVSGGPTSDGNSDPLGGLQLQIGDSTEQSMKVFIDSVSASALGIDNISVVTYENTRNAITACDNANTKVSDLRSRLGAYYNRLEHTASNVKNIGENLQASESRIRDLDMANEMANQFRNNILLQVSLSMLAQSNQQPSNVLSLLK